MSVENAGLVFAPNPRLTDEQRVQAAEKLGYKLDPVGVPDKITIAVCSVSFALTALLIALAWLRRSYTPIRAKNLAPITLMLVAGVVWLIGNLPMKCMVNVAGVWSYCRLWAIVFRLSGTYMFLCFQVFRTIALERIFIQKKPCAGWGFYAPIIAMVGFLLVFNIVTLSIPATKTIVYFPELEVCRYSNPFTYSSMVLSILLWIAYTAFLIRIRNIRSSFNEFRESIIIYIIGSSNIVATVLLYTIVKRSALHQKVRVITTLLDTFTAITPVWLLLAKPVCMCLLKHDGYLAEWKKKLVRDGLAKQYELQNGGAVVSTSNYLSLENGMQNKSTQSGSFNSPAATNHATYTNEAFSSPRYNQQQNPSASTQHLNRPIA